MAYDEEEGFTFIEIVLVLLLVSIIAAVAVPSIRGTMEDVVLDEAAQEVVNVLRYAKNLSTENDTTRLVDFDASQETCSLLLGYQSSGDNLLIFDNTLNPPGNNNWGVRNVKVTDGKTFLFSDNNPYGNVPGIDVTHVDKMEYRFNGSGQNMKLAYSLYDADDADEISIYLNGIKIADAGKGGNNNWTKTRTTSLPSVITGDTSVINPLDKKPYIIDFKASARLKGVDIVSALFGGFDEVTFYSDGTPSHGGTIALSYRGRLKTIVVEDHTGNISVQ